MSDGGALPLALSDLVASLRDAGLVDVTVTAGHAFGGDHEAVNVPSALMVATASGVGGADAVVVAMGPGGVGTGSRLGATALEMAPALDAATALGGRAIAAVRWSDADPRPRHRGLSHHSRTALALAAHPALVPVPPGPYHDVVVDALAAAGASRHLVERYDTARRRRPAGRRPGSRSRPWVAGPATSPGSSPSRRRRAPRRPPCSPPAERAAGTVPGSGG